MSHLGSQISALADGQLPPAAAERVMAHVAGCRECAAELAAARAGRRLLAAAFDVPVAPELTKRLLALGAEPGQASGSWGRSGRHAGAGRGPTQRSSSAGFGAHSLPLPGAGPRQMPTGCLHGDLSAGRRLQSRLVIAAMAGVGVLAAGLFVLGDLPTVVPASHPAHALTVLGRAGDAAAGPQSAADDRDAADSGAGDDPGAAADSGDGAAAIHQAVLPWKSSGGEKDDGADADGADGDGDVPAGSFGLPPVDLDLAAPEAQELVRTWMRGNGWTPLGDLPPGYRVTALRTDAAGGRIEVDLAGPAGLIVVTQEHGRLDPAVAGTATVMDTPGGQVHVMSWAPWHGVWQSGDTVVSVVAEMPSQALVTVLGSYPPRDFDDGVAARIARGWGLVAGTWGP